MWRCSTIISLALLVSQSWAKPVPQDALKVGEGRRSGLNSTTYSKFFEASLLLYAPDTWVEAYRAIPQDEVDCLLTLTHDPSKFKALSSTDDIAVVKKLVAKGCPDGADAIGKFLDAASATIQELPEGLIDALEEFGEPAKAFQDTIRDAHQGVSDITNKTLEDFKTSFVTFITKFNGLSDSDKQKTAQTFPKLKAFITGDDAKTLGDDIIAVISQIGGGIRQASQNPELQTALAKLQTTFKTVITQYLADNQRYVDEASQLIGHDIADCLKNGGIGGFGHHHGGSDGTTGKVSDQGSSAVLSNPWRSGGESIGNLPEASTGNLPSDTKDALA